MDVMNPINGNVEMELAFLETKDATSFRNALTDLMKRTVQVYLNGFIKERVCYINMESWVVYYIDIVKN